MAFNISTADLDGYIKRLHSIQAVIIPTSASVYSPRAGANNYPYWLTLARSITLSRIHAHESRCTFILDMLLIRGGAMSGYDGQREAEILADMMAVASYFERHRDLTSETYPDIQPFFVPNSARITRIERFDGGVQGETSVVGSLYTLEFDHRLIKTVPDV
mgnify:CR=1 FL=1